MSYCTVSDLKLYLGISAATDDVLLADLIATAQAMIDADVGFAFEAASNTTRYFDAEENVEGAILYFDTWCCSINTITNGDATSVLTTQYVTLPRNRSRFHSIKLLPSAAISWTYTSDHEDAIVISGKWAWSTTAPADIEHACRRLSAYLYRQKDNSADLDRALVVGANTTVLPSRIPSDIATILEPYRWRW